MACPSGSSRRKTSCLYDSFADEKYARVDGMTGRVWIQINKDRICSEIDRVHIRQTLRLRSLLGLTGSASKNFSVRAFWVIYSSFPPWCVIHFRCLVLHSWRRRRHLRSMRLHLFPQAILFPIIHIWFVFITVWCQPFRRALARVKLYLWCSFKPPHRAQRCPILVQWNPSLSSIRKQSGIFEVNVDRQVFGPTTFLWPVHWMK